MAKNNSDKSSSKSKTENTSVQAVKERPRIHTIDELRGFAVFCMIFFHAFFTFGYFFNFKSGTALYEFFNPAEPYFAGLFILISGLACNLSHSNLERGIKLAIISLLVSLVTFLVLGSKDMISFGILHFLSAGMIIYGLSNKYLKLIPSILGIIINFFLFILTYSTPSGKLGLPFLFSINLPKELYSTEFLYMFGFPSKNFISLDYFPIIPWLFLFIVGTYSGRIAVKHKFPKFMFKKRIPPLAFLGRHSLIIYLAHQPVIFGLCFLINGISFAWSVVIPTLSAIFRL